MAGRLTTHVLDTASGKPAAGLSIALYRVEGDARTQLKTVVDQCRRPLRRAAARGREFTDRANTSWSSLPATICAARASQLPTPAFLDVVPIRFGMAEPTHYHVPLLVSPYGYSTYRGS